MSHNDGNERGTGENRDSSVVQEAWLALEPMMRRIVREEVEMVFMRHSSNISPRKLELQFNGKPSHTVFANSRIAGADGSLEIRILDASTGITVDSGPEASLQIQLVVLDGDFDSTKTGWTTDQFNRSILKERKGKRSLLSGNTVIGLIGGKCNLDNVRFTDNSSWTRSGNFKLGAKVVGPNSNCVREAQTAPFAVKDAPKDVHRKHYPPSPSDPVWRLEKIAKDGTFHKSLNQQRVFTVADFLSRLALCGEDFKLLLPDMYMKNWKSLVDHARTCTVQNEVPSSSFSTEPLPSRHMPTVAVHPVPSQPHTRLDLTVPLPPSLMSAVSFPTARDEYIRNTVQNEVPSSSFSTEPLRSTHVPTVAVHPVPSQPHTRLDLTVPLPPSLMSAVSFPTARDEYIRNPELATAQNEYIGQSDEYNGNEKLLNLLNSDHNIIFEVPDNYVPSAQNHASDYIQSTQRYASDHLLTIEDCNDEYFDVDSLLNLDMDLDMDLGSGGAADQ